MTFIIFTSCIFFQIIIGFGIFLYLIDEANVRKFCRFPYIPNFEENVGKKIKIDVPLLLLLCLCLWWPCMLALYFAIHLAYAITESQIVRYKSSRLYAYLDI